MRRGRLGVLRLLAALAAAASFSASGARAGHELPFYPGYYPQEIRVETVAPSAAGALLAKSALHAYVGSDPFDGRKVPANIGTSESLASYVVVTLNPASPSLADRGERCEAAARIIKAFARSPRRLRLSPVSGDALSRRLPAARRSGREGEEERSGSPPAGPRRPQGPRPRRGCGEARHLTGQGRRLGRGGRGGRARRPAGGARASRSTGGSDRPGSRRDGSTPGSLGQPRW